MATAMPNPLSNSDIAPEKIRIVEKTANEH
jgi:hypothetical protein